MSQVKKITSTMGQVQGRYGQEYIACQYTSMSSSRGAVWSGGDPLAYTLPVLFAQIILTVLVTRTTFALIKPLKQSMISAQLIAGIIMGESALAKYKPYAVKLFPPGGRLLLETIADMGFMFHLFLVGVQVDTKTLKRAGKNAVIIAIVAYFLPFAFGWSAIIYLPQVLILDNDFRKSLPAVVQFNAMSTFPVITSVLSELKILNSEIGRLATSASLISDTIGYSMATIVGTISMAVHYSHWSALWTVAWVICFLFIIIYGLRPIILHICKRIPEGQPMKEGHFLAIVVLVMICGLCAQALGQSGALAAFVLGITVPDGPPVGTSLIWKLDSLCTGILLPAKFVITGLTMNLLAIDAKNSSIAISVIISLGYMGKFAGTFLPAFFLSILSFWDSVSLGLIMCCKGIMEAAAYMFLRNNNFVDDQTYALLVMSMLILTGATRPLIWYLYDPSTRYLAGKRKSILECPLKSELRMLLCVHNEETVPSFINLLEATNATKTKPICLCVLNLLELSGRAASILVSNSRKRKLTSVRSRSEHISNAFSLFEQHNQGFVTVQHYTSVAPYASMHNDICTIAGSKGAHIIIVAFHKQWAIDGTVGSNSLNIKTVNDNVFKKAPCSVGILVDRGQMSGSLGGIFLGKSLFRIAMVFLGGADDREALAYATRMAEHPQISLAFVWLRVSGSKAMNLEDSQDNVLIDFIRAKGQDNSRFSYKEEVGKDAVDTARVIKSMEYACDLFIAGRHHDLESPLTIGLTQWNECPELGVIGDMLFSSDFKFSFLVVQQQPPEYKVPEVNGINLEHITASRVHPDPDHV